ncbi:MAG: hypothetical protein HOB84_07395 [Candidatus Marinimicrobia bacterium]|jgi:hypothetical protein|nr:hypothetical protein [Candidatus Neomarinimicrobiota bacterium]MBT4360363.1 hypothetical protein [Candidatus Neomarinimicrobiota bacterium]MBT4714580.1 hypothetical protein [Candidatus Neomarinimicrobiota bacterium]MBT4946619.1 hypothetical protein [Candidatus Neomarinimicrobiota bacterium]MBT5270302.1 hypothetical protein [Candidatus Neomarinimicrobiota bacterium]
MSKIDSHPILGQLNDTQRRLTDVAEIQEALAERRRVMERDGKYTTVVAGVIGITGLFFMKPLPFYLVLGLLVVGLPLVWRHLVKEAREFIMTNEEIQTTLQSK